MAKYIVLLGFDYEPKGKKALRFDVGQTINDGDLPKSVIDGLITQFDPPALELVGAPALTKAEKTESED